MKLLALENASDYQELTFCGGTIQGGTGATSVPGHCRLQVNVRIRTHSAVETALNLLRQQAQTNHVPGTSCTLTVHGTPFPMEEKQTNIDLCEKFSTVSESLGFGSFGHRFVGGASDAAHASAMNIPVVCASGPIVDFQHTKNERVLIGSMVQRAKIHALTILELS